MMLEHLAAESAAARLMSAMRVTANRAFTRRISAAKLERTR
jgi:hypothetical protein